MADSGLVGDGVREIKYNTYQTVFSTAHPVRRQLPAIWLAGVIVAAAMGAGFAIRMIINGGAQESICSSCRCGIYTIAGPGTWCVDQWQPDV